MDELIQATGLHEECGVFGIYDKTGETDMVSAVYSALYALQHRGQESCGIALNVDGVLSGHRDLGLVSEVFTKRVLEDLPRGAKMATGHVRYATAGQRVRNNAQPMILHHCKGAMAVCHNGNLVNAAKLRRKLEMSVPSSTAPPTPRSSPICSPRTGCSPPTSRWRSPAPWTTSRARTALSS